MDDVVVNGRRYLIVRIGALGDVATGSAMVGAIRDREPQAHITWLCGARVADLVALFDGVDDVIAADEVALMRGPAPSRIRAVLSLWQQLVFRRFDVTLLAHGDLRYRLLLFPIRTGRLRALEHDVSAEMLPIPGRYLGDEFVRLLSEGPATGPVQGHQPLADLRSTFAAAEGAMSAGVVIVPGGARNVLREDSLRRWPAERYAELAARLIERGCVVTLAGDSGDAWVRPHFGGLQVRDEIGRHAIAGTLGILATAEAVVTHDTGLLHLARLVRRPVVALFGPTIPSKVVVAESDVRVLWGGADLACRPCYNGREFAHCGLNLCMRDISVSAVLASLDELLVSHRRMDGAGKSASARLASVAPEEP